MALFHMRVKAISRGQGKNIIKSASYRSGERLYDEQNKTLTKQYSRQERVVHSEIVLPENAPAEFSDRATLWNTVEKTEKRKDSQLAREVEFALPKELPEGKQADFCRDFIKRNFTEKGMIADFAVHNNEGNPHCHVLLTTREVTKDGFGKKNREWNDRVYYETVRKDYEETQNKFLDQVGSQERVSRLSYADRGLNQKPTIHEGWRKDNKEKRKKINEEIRAENREIKAIEQELRAQKQAELVENKAKKQAQLVETQQNVKTQQFVDSKKTEKRESPQPATSRNEIQSGSLSHGEIAHQTPQNAPDSILNTQEGKRTVKALQDEMKRIEKLEKDIKADTEKIKKLEKRETFLNAEIDKFNNQTGVSGWLNRKVYNVEPAQAELEEIKQDKEKTEKRIKSNKEAIEQTKKNMKITISHIESLKKGKTWETPHTDHTTTRTREKARTQTKTKPKTRFKGR